jgi:hypothetical protein
LEQKYKANTARAQEDMRLLSSFDGWRCKDRYKSTQTTKRACGGSRRNSSSETGEAKAGPKTSGKNHEGGILGACFRVNLID